MPEGHTLHRLAAELGATFGGKPIRSSSPQGRFAAAAARVDRTAFGRAEAFGKHLFVSFGGHAEVAHVHLGLYGAFTIVPDPELPVRGAVRWRIVGEHATADLRGPTTCELIAPSEVEDITARLGPDPLRADADPERAWQRIKQSRSAIARLLMDQSVIAGVGNVYRAELLFRHGIDPFRSGTTLIQTEWDAMWSDLASLMRTGVRSGRIDTVRPEHEPDAMRRAPRRDDHGGEVYVYRRAGAACHVCGTRVQSETIANRNLFWCPSCQPRR